MVMVLTMGDEYIKITGVTSRSIIMKAFGYQAGFAHIDYSWTGTQSCTEESGTGDTSGNTQVQADLVILSNKF